MIFFNVPEARRELLDKGLVYTLRSSFRAVGETKAVTGSYHKHEPLCDVEVSRVTTVSHPSDLYPYLHHSGFTNVDDWLQAAKLSARTLYRVDRRQANGNAT